MDNISEINDNKVRIGEINTNNRNTTENKLK